MNNKKPTTVELNETEKLIKKKNKKYEDMMRLLIQDILPDIKKMLKDKYNIEL